VEEREIGGLLYATIVVIGREAAQQIAAGYSHTCA
jgi:hypothetical protein